MLSFNCEVTDGGEFFRRRLGTRTRRTLYCRAKGPCGRRSTGIGRQAKKYVESKAEGIFRFAYPSATPADVSSKPKLRFDGHHVFEDGFELTFTFHWDPQPGVDKESFATLGFLFDGQGKADGILVKDFYVYRDKERDPQKARYVTKSHVPPFLNDLTDRFDLSGLRSELLELPAVKANRKHLRAVDTATARELCELWLRLEQGKK